MNTSLCCAYLRVYLPLDALSSTDRARVDRTVPSRTSDTAVRPHPLGLVAAEERREFYQRVVEGRRYVCPAETRLRTLLGLVAFERSIPDGTAQLFFAPEDLEAAHSELEELQAGRPELRPTIVQSAWHVPIRWFVCFDDAERRIEQDDDHLRIRYETTVGRARERVNEALDILKDGIVHPVIAGMVFELKEWLASFDPRSLLELDYASVSRLFEDDELADDHSAQDVRNAICALAEGDGLRAGLYYQRVNERWSRARGRESFN